jgi:hypothetical protein
MYAMARTTHTQTVLEIDIAGYRQTLENKGKPRILIEALSNAFDPKGTTVVIASLTKEGQWATLTVKDNDPDGFANLKDAFTLFAASNRREDPEARGRFGQGEKEIVAICCDGSQASLTIKSTTGTVEFDQSGRYETPSERTVTGTELTAVLKLNQKDVVEFMDLVRYIIVPEGVTFTFNGKMIERPTITATACETLPTVIWDAEGNLVNTRRQTNIEFIDRGVEQAWIFELGIPVVEHDGRFHINVMQKVPLNSARDNVNPGYLRKLREIMLNETHDILTSVDMKSAWVSEAKHNANEDALRSYSHQVYGPNAVIADPSNHEATKRAHDQNRTVIYSRTEDTDIFKKLKKYDIVKPAGQVIQTSVPTSPDGIPPIPKEQWTPEMFQVEEYIHALGEHALGFTPTVEYSMATTGGKRYEASWGGSTITFYFRHVGRHFPETVTQERLDALVIHEFTHHTADDHFTDRFIHDIAGIGARLRSCPARLEDYRS